MGGLMQAHPHPPRQLRGEVLCWGRLVSYWTCYTSGPQLSITRRTYDEKHFSFNNITSTQNRGNVQDYTSMKRHIIIKVGHNTEISSTDHVKATCQKFHFGKRRPFSAEYIVATLRKAHVNSNFRFFVYWSQTIILINDS